MGVTLGLGLSGGLVLPALAAATIELSAWGWLRTQARTLVLDEAGYAIEARGRERLRVGWSEVRRVLHDPGEDAVYVDCGDKARNLLIPPARGFGFHVAEAAAATARVLAAVPAERVETVERLEEPRP